MCRWLGGTWRTRIRHDEFLAPETDFRVLIANVPEPCLTAGYAGVTSCRVGLFAGCYCCRCGVESHKSRCGCDGDKPWIQSRNMDLHGKNVLRRCRIIAVAGDYIIPCTFNTGLSKHTRPA